MDRYMSIGEAAAYLGVSVTTLRRWEKSGYLISAHRTFGNHRRYSVEQCNKLLGLSDKNIQKTICYARVSSHDQKHDLTRQSERLALWCEDNKIADYEVITDLGSGLNYKKRGLSRLIGMIMRKEFSHLVITHKDRLLRFGSDMLMRICELNGIRVSIVNEDDVAISRETELVKDVIELMTVFSARLYGSRSKRNKKLLLSA